MAERAGYDVAVIGAGVVGSALALGLVRAGQRVALLDAGDDQLHASGGNFGLVWVQGKGAGVHGYAAWTRAAAELWPAFAADLRAASDVDVAYARTGGLAFCLGEAELERRVTLVKRMHNQPPPAANDTEILDEATVRRLVPGLGPAVAGASFCPHDGHVDPLRLVRALQTALLRAGGAIHRRATARSIEAGSPFVVRTAEALIEADKVVLAAGLANAELAPTLGLEAAVRPQRGQILVTQRLPPLCAFATNQLRQTADGTVMLGDTKEDAGFDISTTQTAAAALARRAIACFPALASAHVVRQWAALRVMSADGLPIYAESPEHPGAFLATCHSGVTLAAMHAGPLAEAIAQGGLPPEVDAFRPGRFAAAAAGAAAGSAAGAAADVREARAP
ncbi:MAG: NAD(P)/FAD-dependent oxidoreductase [Pseudomonadota bacterium]